MSDEIATNVEQTFEETATEQEVLDSTTGSQMSFDDLDALTSEKTSQELANEAKDFLDKGAEKETKAEENKSNSGDKDKRKAEKENNKKEEDVGEEEIKEIKKLLGKYDDKEQEIAADTKFSHKVDGEDVDVSLQDLLNNYSGKVSYDKKFQELSGSKKEYEQQLTKYKQEKEAVNQYIGKFAEIVQSGDALGAVTYLAEFAGRKPYEFRKELLEQIAPEIQRRNGLSPEEMQRENLIEENDYLEKLKESELSRRQTQQTQSELQARIKNIQETQGISSDDFNQYYRELQENNYQGQITPEIIGEYAMHKNAYIKASGMVEEVMPSLATDSTVIESIQAMIVENPGYGDDIYRELVQEAYGNILKESSSKVSKKVSGTKKAKAKAEPKAKEDFTSFDDL